MNVQQIEISKMPFASLFKVSFFVGLFFWVVLGLLILILSIIAPSTVTINHETATGIGDGVKGLLLSITIGSMLSLAVAAIGAGIVRLASNKISLGYIDI